MFSQFIFSANTNNLKRNTKKLGCCLKSFPALPIFLKVFIKRDNMCGISTDRH